MQRILKHTTNIYSPGVYIDGFRVRKSQFMLNNSGIINTTIEDFLTKAQQANFTLSTGKVYSRLNGKYLNEDVEIVLHPSNNNEIAEIYIYFSAFSSLKKAVVLCNRVSEQIEENYGAIVNTYFFDTENFSNKFDDENIIIIEDQFYSSDTYIWLITGTKHEVINLCLEYISKKRVYVPVLKVKVKKYVKCSIPSKRAILHNYHYIKKPKRYSKFLDLLAWNRNDNIQNIQLTSPIGLLEIVKKRDTWLGKCYISQKEDIFTFNKKIQESYFKIQNDFISGIYYDLSDSEAYSAYAFVLYFAILDIFKYNDNKDILNLLKQIDILCICCPKIREYLHFIMSDPDYSNSVYQSLDDNSKLKLMQWFPELKNKFSIPDYAKLVLHRNYKDVELLKGFKDFPINCFCLCKTYAKRYKISNDILRQDSFEIFLMVLKKMGGVNAAFAKSIKQFCVGNREFLNKKEEHKLQNIHNDLIRLIDYFYDDIVGYCVCQIYQRNNIGTDESRKTTWSLFECACIKQYIEEALSEYYYGKQPQKGYIPVPRKISQNDK